MWVEQRPFNSFINERYSIGMGFFPTQHSDDLLCIMKRILSIINTQTGETTTSSHGSVNNLYKKKTVPHLVKYLFAGFRIGDNASLTPT